MNPTKDTIKKVRKTISRHGMINSEDVLIVAVSGGPDSVCLLDILQELREELRIKLVVAHYNHGLRPAEDESETQLVHRLASSMNLPFQTEKASSILKVETASIEEKARDLRYRFLERLMDTLHAQKIAVGHNLNDQAETVLMRLLRGAGPPGLAGIPPTRDNRIIRPLIEIKQEEIELYLKARGLPYVIDRSNLESKYLRNKIRLELLPLMLEYQPRLVEHLGELAVILRADDEYLKIHAEKWIEREAVIKLTGDIFIPVPSFIELSQPIRNRVTRHLLAKIGEGLRRIDRGHIHSVYTLAQSDKPQGMINLPNGLRVKKIYDRLAFTSGEEKKPRDFLYSLEKPGTLFLEPVGRSVSLEEIVRGGEFNMKDSPWTAYLDAEKLSYPLVVRNFRPGDRFVPLGMSGHKKVKDFFTDLKVPRDLRASVPILVSDGTLVWICGHRIDERFKVTSKTRKVLKITMS